MAEQFGEVGIQGLRSSNPGVMRPLVGTIAGTKSFTCMHKLHLSLLSSNKLLPTRYAPLEIELSLISTASDWQGLAGVEVVGWTKPPSARFRRRWEWACFDPGGPVEVEAEVDLPRRSEVSRRWVHPSAQGRGTASSPGGSHS